MNCIGQYPGTGYSGIEGRRDQITGNLRLGGKALLLRDPRASTPNLIVPLSFRQIQLPVYQGLAIAACISDTASPRFADDPDLPARFDIITSIPGCAAITAFSLLIDMPELGSLEPGQAASLAGLAPTARQSGKWTGRSFIRAGRANVRQALYMPALVALRFNPDLKAKYQ